MNVDVVPPSLLQFPLVVWFLGSGALTFLGYGQYGLATVAPAVIAAGISVAIVYAVTRRGAGQHSWPVAAVMVTVAALAATAVLPLSMLWILAAFGIDGP